MISNPTFYATGKTFNLDNKNLMQVLDKLKNDPTQIKSILRQVAKKALNGLKNGTLSLTDARLLKADIGLYLTELAKRHPTVTKQLVDIPKVLNTKLELAYQERNNTIDKNKDLIEKLNTIALSDFEKLLGIRIEEIRLNNNTKLLKIALGYTKNDTTDGVLNSIKGMGNTYNEALQNLADKLSGKILVLNPHDKFRKEIRLPVVTVNKACEEYSFFN